MKEDYMFVAQFLSQPQKEVKIEIPEGYEIDKEKSTFEKIVFKKKDTKPKSWEEYCNQQKNRHLVGYYINNIHSKITACFWKDMENSSKWVSVLPSRELAEAFLAMMQLMSLRQAWIGDWKPDWKDHTQWKANILCENRGFDIADFCDLISRPLSFPTREMAEEFMNCFKDLLEVAKPLI